MSFSAITMTPPCPAPIRSKFVRALRPCWNGSKATACGIVETASRFARDLMVQEVGFAKLRERGIDLIAADKPDSFVDDTPTATLVRQILGAISEFDKAMTVAKLRGARERKRREAGKCEGRKSHAERNPGLVALAKRLHRQKPKSGRLSLRAISAELAAAGFLNENGQPFAAASVKSMLKG
jgi:DNA invertase Pin-like site-specific DNA recombinase